MAGRAAAAVPAAPRRAPVINADATNHLLESVELIVRWGDMDALGHVNNATYFTYCEQCRIAWLDRMAIGESVGRGSGAGPVIVNAFCAFLRPVVYPARVRVSMYGGTPGRSSFETRYEIRDGADSEILYATGSAKIVWVDHRAGRSTPIPDAVRQLLPASTETP